MIIFSTSVWNNSIRDKSKSQKKSLQNKTWTVIIINLTFYGILLSNMSTKFYLFFPMPQSRDKGSRHANS